MHLYFEPIRKMKSAVVDASTACVYEDSGACVCLSVYVCLTQVFTQESLVWTQKSVVCVVTAKRSARVTEKLSCILFQYSLSCQKLSKTRKKT